MRIYFTDGTTKDFPHVLRVDGIVERENCVDIFTVEHGDKRGRIIISSYHFLCLEVSEYACKENP